MLPFLITNELNDWAKLLCMSYETFNLSVSSANCQLAHHSNKLNIKNVSSDIKMIGMHNEFLLVRICRRFQSILCCVWMEKIPDFFINKIYIFFTKRLLITSNIEFNLKLNLLFIYFLFDFMSRAKWNLIWNGEKTREKVYAF